MKKNILVIFLLFAGFVLANATTVRVSSKTTEIILRAETDTQLKFTYFGKKLSPQDFKVYWSSGASNYDAYPAYGLICQAETALSVVHADGNLSTDLRVKSFSQEQSGDVVLTKILLKDAVYPFEVLVCYKAYQDVDMIETWTEISNKGKKTIKLNQFASGYLPIRRGNVWLSSLHGYWASESTVVEEKLLPGLRTIKNRDGVKNSATAHAEVMFSLDGKGQENYGNVIGAALCYSGNYELTINTDYSDWHHFVAGICPENSSYNLKKNETFVTPPLALTFSNEGLSGASRNFHKWGRKYKLSHGDRERNILLNSWEGVYFDITEEGMDQMMGDIASMGGELFVMDDGWFGVKYPRVKNNCGLGDWQVDRKKLPNGVPGLVQKAKEHGIKFGIWIEPEMTNSLSELYEKHPEWVIKAPERKLVNGRGGTQLVLDLSNPEVQDYVVKVVDDLMTENPEISYIKWDANMSILNHGSQYLSGDNQSHLMIEYHKGFAKVCDRIRAKYPDLTIQACASGGGRANWGVLPWFDEFWVSDNTDALQRIYIQWGASYFFPSIAMASHISATPNHTLHRTTSLKFRIDVAMSGRLGMEIQPKNMTEDEKEMCRKAIAEYKEIRHVVQFGDLYRLVSPYSGANHAAMMYCSEDKNKAVFYWWKLETMYNEHFPLIKLAGLDPDKYYKIKELNRIDKKPLSYEGKTFSGRHLMTYGLHIPYKHNVDNHLKNDWSSRVLYLEVDESVK